MSKNRRTAKGKNLEYILNESELGFRSLVENAFVGVAIADLKGRFVYVNKALSEMLGYSVEELLGRQFKDFLHPNDRGKVMRLFLRIIVLRRQPRALEFRVIRKDGEVLQLWSRPSRFVVNGKTLGFHAVIVDISELKETERRLRETNKKLEMILEGAMEGITIVDADDNLTFVNKAFADIVGYKENELIGMNLRKLVDIEGFRKILAETKIRKKRGVSRYELILYRKNGEQRVVQVSASPIWNDDGTYAGAMAIVMDITEQKEMEEKLRGYMERLEEMVEEKTRKLKQAQEQLLKAERLAAIGQVAAMVGHDLRNPLTSIASTIYYLKRKLGSQADKKIREMLELIEADIQYANNIMADLLEYSGEKKLEVKEISLKSLVNEALSALRIPENIKVIDLTEEVMVKVDKDKMKRVFVNIVKNAVDAMPEGGKLVIKSRKANNFLEVSFSDTGVGMPKEVLEKIWKPFFTTKSKGLGLGLPICKRIVEAHGGKIFVKSAVGKGTTFTVIMPVQLKLDGGEKVWVNMPESSSSTMMKA